MFSKLIALILLIVGVYLISVFVIPEIADQYGNKELNTKIREIKDQSLHFASGSDSPASLADKLMSTGKDVIDETKKTTDQIQATITEKTEQAKKAAESANQAIDAVGQAKKDIQNLTNFSGSIR